MAIIQAGTSLWKQLFLLQIWLILNIAAIWFFENTWWKWKDERGNEAAGRPSWVNCPERYLARPSARSCHGSTYGSRKKCQFCHPISLLSESFHRCITLEVLIHSHHIITALNCYPLNFRCRVQPRFRPLNLTSYCLTLYYSPNSIGSNTIQPARAVIGSPFWPSQSPCS